MSDIAYTDDGIPYDPNQGYNPLYPQKRQEQQQQYSLPAEGPTIEQKMNAITVRIPKSEPAVEEIKKEPILKPVEHDPFIVEREGPKLIADKLFGLNGQERYQLWPERMVREAVTAPNKALTEGFVPGSADEIGAAQSIAGMAGMGSMPMVKNGLGMIGGRIVQPSFDENLITKAKSLFGVTTNPKEAGYVMPDGSMLDLSGRHYAGGYENINGKFVPQKGQPDYLANTRNVDHRELEDLGSGTEGMRQFMNNAGAIRNSPGIGFDTTIVPTDKQLNAIIAKHNMTFRGEPLNVDISNPQTGENLASKEFAKPSIDAVKKWIQQETAKYPTLFNDNKAGTAIGALAQSQKAPVFYSALENAVNGVSANKMQPQQWLGTLQNAKGVKPEEMEWTGLKDWLAEKKGPVSKQEIQDFINSNKVELKEVNKGDLKFNKESKYAIPEVIKAAKEAGDTPGDLELTLANDGNAYRALMKKFPELKGNEDWATVVSRDVFGGDSMPAGTTKYSKYQLPAGENYREMLLTLPSQSKENFIKEWKNKTGVDISNYTDEQINRLRKEGEGIISDTQYKSSHWDEPNVLAHVRMNDRTIDGKRSLHLEEIQSDWHQQGRDEGYRQENVDINNPEFVKWMENRWGINKTDKDYVERADALKSEYGSVPNAPFKKTWHELALKRMLREAAEKGYDRLSWTPGEAQAARYDLSKQVKRIYLENPVFDENGKFLRGTLQAEGSGGGLLNQSVTSDNISNYIGKEAAKKIIDSPTRFEGPKDRPQTHVLEGNDLKVGGEGMRGFYDKIIPKALEKIGKEHGVKVKSGSANTGYEAVTNSGEVHANFKDRVSAQDWIDKTNGAYKGKTNMPLYKLKEKSEPIHYIDIPQSLKDQALKKGFPLFSSSPVLVPVDHNPFADEEILKGNAT